MNGRTRALGWQAPIALRCTLGELPLRVKHFADFAQ